MDSDCDLTIQEQELVAKKVRLQVTLTAEDGYRLGRNVKEILVKVTDNVVIPSIQCHGSCRSHRWNRGADNALE